MYAYWILADALWILVGRTSAPPEASPTPLPFLRSGRKRTLRQTYLESSSDDDHNEDIEDNDELAGMFLIHSSIPYNFLRLTV